MLYELRQYWARPGRRHELVELMEQRILPMQAAAGVDVVASFVSVDDPDGYTWIRRWASEDERERISAAVYGSAEWIEELLPAVRALMVRDRTVVTALRPTSISPLR
ncbi:MAG TPA: NIPSNAP family protein [Ilumatobacter sp.]|nr:NIPSNAP family protein [Ilumatobacter sp.]